MLTPIEEIIGDFDLDQIGEILGSGQNTFCIKPEKEWAFSKIDKAVLIITREPQKRVLLNSIFEGTDAKTEKIKIKDIKDSTIQATLWELKSRGLDVFFSSKLKWDQINFSDAIFFSAFTANHWSNPHADMQEWIDNFEEDVMASGMKSEYIDAAKTALKRVSHLIKKPVVVDLHKDQFFRDSLGNLICIDPVYFTSLDF